MHKETLLTALIILGVFLSGTAFAGTKFINKDTAKERNPIIFGTEGNKSDITIKSDKESNMMSIKPKKEKQEAEQPVGPIFVVPEIKPSGD